MKIRHTIKLCSNLNRIHHVPVLVKGLTRLTGVELKYSENSFCNCTSWLYCRMNFFRMFRTRHLVRINWNTRMTLVHLTFLMSNKKNVNDFKMSSISHCLAKLNFLVEFGSMSRWSRYNIVYCFSEGVLHKTTYMLIIYKSLLTVRLNRIWISSQSYTYI